MAFAQLMVKLGLNPTAYNRELDKAGAKANQFYSSASHNAMKLGLAFLGVRGIKELFKFFIKAGEDLKGFREDLEKLGMAVDDNLLRKFWNVAQMLHKIKLQMISGLLPVISQMAELLTSAIDKIGVTAAFYGAAGSKQNPISEGQQKGLRMFGTGWTDILIAGASLFSKPNRQAGFAAMNKVEAEQAAKKKEDDARFAADLAKANEQKAVHVAKDIVGLEGLMASKDKLAQIGIFASAGDYQMRELSRQQLNKLVEIADNTSPLKGGLL